MTSLTSLIKTTGKHQSTLTNTCQVPRLGVRRKINKKDVWNSNKKEPVWAILTFDRFAFLIPVLTCGRPYIIEWT